MAVFFLDNFVDTDGTNLGSHTPDTGTGWTNHPALNGGATGAIQNNRHYGGTTNAHWFVDDAAPGATADYRVTGQTYENAVGGNTLGVYLYARLDTSVNTGYWLRSYDSTGGDVGQIQLGKTVTGTNTILGQLSSSYGAYQSVIMELEVEGTAIRAYVRLVSSGDYILGDGTTTSTRTACFSVTDGSITAAGRAGLNAGNSLSTTRTHFESFQAETLTNEYTESVTSNLSLTQVLNEIPRSASNTLALTQSVLRTLIIQDRQVPESTLAFVQSATVEGLINSVASPISFVSTATAEILGQPEISQNLGLSSVATSVFGVPHSAPWGLANITQELGLVSSQDIERPISGTSTITFTQEAVVSYGLESTLGFSQTVSGGVGYEIEQDLGIGQTVSRGGSIWSRSISQTAAFTSASLGWNGNDPCFRRFGVDSRPQASGKLTLYSMDGLYSVELRNPEIDNVRRTAYDRVVRETRGGDLIVYRDPSWASVQTLQYSIVALKRSTLDSLQTFFGNTLGQEIVLVDWLGEEWSGVVIRPDETFTEDRDGYWTFAFEFEGTKLGGSGSYQNLNLSSQASATVV